MTNLKLLDLSDNPGWWNHEEAQGYLIEFLQDQTCLESLLLTDNNFNDELTGQILTALTESSCKNTIKCLILEKSGNYTTQETLEALAEFVNMAKQLVELDISGQTTDRKVKLVVEMSDGGSGSLGSI